MIAKNTGKVLLFMLKSVNEFGYNINQISRYVNISVGSAFKILKELEFNEIVVRKKIGNSSNYKINYDSAEAVKVLEILLIREKRLLNGYAKIYADDIVKYTNSDIILLFGSVLKGKSFNDVDVFFVTNRVKKVSDFCLDISSIRTKPVVPLILKKEDLIKEIKSGKESILDMLKNCVVLRGEELFVEVIKNVDSSKET